MYFDWVQATEVGRNIALTLSAPFAAWIAWRGLNTWKNQTIWEQDTDHARKLLMALYRYRNAVYGVRHPAMYHSEMKVDDEEAKNIDAKDQRSAGIINAYAKRWSRVSDTKSELDAILMEATAVWGDDFQALMAPLYELENELFGYINLWLDANYRGETDLAKSYRDTLKSKRDILYDRLNDEDEFRADFKSALSGIEAYLRRKLGGKT